MARRHLTLAERFWTHVRKTRGCWIWMGGRNSDGYGVLRVGGARAGFIRAHRLAYELAHGVKLGASECALHHCDNPACVRPSHLFCGMQRENVRDCQRKGRLRNQYSKSSVA